MDAHDRPGERAPVRERDARVQRLRRADEVPGGRLRDERDPAADVLQDGRAEGERRDAPAPALGVRGTGGVGAGEQRREEVVAHGPPLQRVERQRDAVVQVVRLARQHDAEPAPHEAPHRVLEHVDDRVEVEAVPVGVRAVVDRGERGGQERRRPGAGVLRAHGGAVPQRVEAERAVAPEGAGGEVAGVRGLQRVTDDEPVARGCAAGCGHRRVHGVEQLRDGHRGRPGRAGALVEARVQDDEVLGRGRDRVEEELPVLGTRVALTDERVGPEDVVAVVAAAPGEGAVVHPEQAHHPVGDGAHGLERADRQGAGAEPRPGGTPAQTASEQRPDVREPQRRRVALRRLADLAEHRARLDELPRVRRRDVAEQRQGAVEGREPRVGGPGRAEGGEGHGEAVDELGEPPGEVDVVAVDVVERQRGAEEALVLVGHRGTEQQTVDARLPRALRTDAREAEARAARDVLAPADTGLLHPRGDALDVLVGEHEPLPHGRARQQVHDLRRADPGAGELEHVGQQREQGVRLAQGAVGDADAQRPARVRAGTLVLLDAERRGDERGERLHVRAHHHDVPRLEGGVVRQQADDDLAQHLDLTRAAVAGVHLHAAVAGGVVEDGGSAARVVVPDPRLQVPERRGRRARRGQPRGARAEVRHPDLQFGRVPGHRRQQRVATRHPEPRAAQRQGGEGGLHAAPQLRGRVREPQVHRPVLAERREHRELVAGQARGPEHREPGGEVDRGRLVAQQRDGVVEPLGGARRAEVGAQPAPQVRLPRRPGSQRRARAVVVPPFGPPQHHLRALRGVRGEQARDVLGGAHPPRAARVVLVRSRPQVPRERCGPRLAEARVDDVHDVPDQPGRVPGVVLGTDAEDGRHRLRDHPPRGVEPHVRADAVTGRAGAQPVRQALRHPALDAPRRHRDDLGRERVRRGVEQQLREPVDEHVGPLADVRVQPASRGRRRRWHERHGSRDARHGAARRRAPWTRRAEPTTGDGSRPTLAPWSTPSRGRTPPPAAPAGWPPGPPPPRTASRPPGATRPSSASSRRSSRSRGPGCRRSGTTRRPR